MPWWFNSTWVRREDIYHSSQVLCCSFCTAIAFCVLCPCSGFFHCSCIAVTSFLLPSPRTSTALFMTVVLFYPPTLFLHQWHNSLSLHLPLQPKHQDTFSLPPQRPLTTINPIGHSLHPNGAPTLKPPPVPRTIQAMPWEQRSLYNQWDTWGTNTSLFASHLWPHTFLLHPDPLRSSVKDGRLPDACLFLQSSSGTLFGIGGGHRWELVEIDYWVVRFKTMCCLDPHVWSMPCTGYKLKCLSPNLSSLRIYLPRPPLSP